MSGELCHQVEKGETVCELETIEGKIKRDLLYKADGTLAELEEILTAGMVPNAIGSPVRADSTRGKIVNGEKTTRDKEVSFDTVVLNGKENVIVKLNADGKIQQKTASTSKKSRREKEEWEEDEKENQIRQQGTCTVHQHLRKGLICVD